MLPDSEYDEIFSAVSLWQDRWHNGARPSLTYRKACSSILIEDTRGSESRTLDYSDGAAALYEFCLDAKTQNAIETEFGASDWLPGALSEFRDRDQREVASAGAGSGSGRKPRSWREPPPERCRQDRRWC